MRECANATLVAHPKAARHLVDPSRIAAGTLAVGDVEDDQVTTNAGAAYLVAFP